jgi:hypothetical protein
MTLYKRSDPDVRGEAVHETAGRNVTGKRSTPSSSPASWTK